MAVITPAVTLFIVISGVPVNPVALPVTSPVTSPVKLPLNVVAVTLPAPTSIPLEFAVIIPATTDDAAVATPVHGCVVVVVTPLTTAPSGKVGETPDVLPLKLVTLKLDIRDLRFEGHQ